MCSSLLHLDQAEHCAVGEREKKEDDEGGGGGPQAAELILIVVRAAQSEARLRLSQWDVLLGLRHTVLLRCGVVVQAVVPDGACEKHFRVPNILGGGEDAGDKVAAFLGFLRRAGDPLLVLTAVHLPHDVDVT